MKKQITLLAFVLMAAVGNAQSPAPTPGPNEGYYKSLHYLDQGGSFYLYGSVKGALESFLAALKAELGAADPMVAAGLQSADNVLTHLGLFGLHDIGVSAIKEESGQYLNKLYLSAPGGRSGLLSLLGGDAHPFEVLKLAPADSILVMATDFESSKALGLVRQVLADAAGDEGVHEFETAMAQSRAEFGTDVETILRSLDGHLFMIAGLDPERKLTRLGSIPADLAAPLVMMGVRVKDATLYETFLNQMNREGLAEPEETVGTRRQFKLVQPPSPASPLRGVIAQEGNHCYISTDLDYLNRVLAKTAPDATIATAPEFLQASNGIPTEGNGVLYLSGRFQEYAQQIMATIADGSGQPNTSDLAGWKQFLRPPPGGASPAFTVRRNFTDGVQWISRSQASPQVLAGGAIVFPIAAAIGFGKAAQGQMDAASRVLEEQNSAPSGAPARPAQTSPAE